VSASILIAIPYQWRSLNDYTGQQWHRKQRDTKAAESLIQMQLLSIGELCRTLTPTVEHRWLRLIRYSRRKITDDDNLRGGSKPIKDAIKRLHLIHDDSMKWLTVYYEQFVLSECPYQFNGRTVPCVRVEIFTCDPFPARPINPAEKGE
jgi:hypothetical protein